MPGERSVELIGLVERGPHRELAGLDEVLHAHAVAQDVVELLLHVALVVVLVVPGLLDLPLCRRDHGIGSAQLVAESVEQLVELGTGCGCWRR